MTEYNMENQDLVFVDGMNFKEVAPNAPQTVRGKIYFNWSKFKKYAEENVDQKGWLNVKMMKSSKTGNIYFIKDTFVPKIDAQEAIDYNENKYKHSDPNVQLANEKTAEQLFNRPLTDEDQEYLASIPF